MTTEQCWEMVYPLGDTRRCRNQARAGKATCYLHAPSESSIAWRLTSPKDEPRFLRRPPEEES